MGLTTVIRDYGTDILNAIRENDLHKLKLILEKTLRSDAKIAKLCVTDIKHKPTKKFACPLILAARQEDPRIMKYMMDKGTDPNFVHHTIFSSKRREIVTALHLAVDLGHYDTAEVLLNANADANIYDHNRETPLHIAVKKADHTMMKLLLSKGADPLIPDNKNNAALHIATLYGHLQMVRTLLKYDADIYQKGQLDVIPPHIAAKEGHSHLVQLFSANDLANINVKIPCYLDRREKAPIHLAAENGHAECLSVLLDEFEADVNLKDSDGNTALHCVVLRPYDVHRMRDKEYFTQSARLLLKFRISINEKNIFGDTALHFAAMNHYHRIVELLLENGANPFLENEDGMKPIDTVPDSDPVTKQILKMAMLKGRPTLSASLSHQRHITESSFNNTTLQESAFDQSRSNISYKSASSTSSVFIDDTRPRRPHRSRESKSKSKLPNVEETANTEDSQQSQQHQQVIPAPPPLPQHGDIHQKVENEISIYSKVNKKSKQKHGQELQRNLGYDQQEWEAISTTTMNEGSVHSSVISQHNTSKISQEIKTGGHEQSQQQLVAEISDAVKQQNYINRKKRCKKHRPSSSERDDLSLDTAIPEPGQEAHWGQLPEKGEVIYENVPPVPAAESAPPLPPRKNRSVPVPTDERQAGDVEPLEYTEEGGVQVHTLPGRPGAIEVQYKGGPITISVDTPKEYYEGDHKHKDSDNTRSPKMSSKQKRHPPFSPKQYRKHSSSPKTKRKRDQTPAKAQLYNEEPEQQPMDVHVSLGRTASPHKQRVGSDSQGTGQDYYTEYYRQKAMKKIKRKQKSKEGQEEPYNVYAEVEQSLEDYFNGTYDISELESLQQSLMSESSQPELITRIIEQKIAELLEQKAKKTQKDQRPQDKMKQWLLETDEQDDETEEEEKQHILDSDEWNDDEEFQTPSKWLEMDESGSEDDEDNNEEDEENIDNEDEDIKMQEINKKVSMKSTPVKQHTTEVLRKQPGDSQIEIWDAVKTNSDTAESPSKYDHITPRKSHPKLPKAQQLDAQTDQHIHAEDSSPVQEDSPTRMTFQEKLAWAKAQEKKEAEAKGTPTKVRQEEKGSCKVQKKQDKMKQKEEFENKPSGISEMIKRDHSEYYSLTHDIEGSTVSSTSTSVGTTSKDTGESQAKDDTVVEQYEGSPFSQRKRNVGQADGTVNEISPVTSRKRSKSQSDILDVNEDQGTVSPVTLQDINKKGIRTTSVLSEGSGLGLRVSGEVPKAYTHNDKSSARRAFMMADPVRIESNSECSDTELHGSKGSLSGVGTHKDRGKLWEEPIMKPVYPKHSSGLTGTATISDSEISLCSDDSTKRDTKLIGGYAKPYKSFGKIEVKTDLIEEAMLNASIPEDPETVSDLEPFEVSDLEKEGQEEEQKTESDINLPPVTVDASQGRTKSSKHLQIEMLDKEPRGASYSKTQESPQQPAHPLPLNSPPAIKPSESQLSPRSDTSSKSGRKVVCVKEQRRGEHGDIIETITTTVIKREVPQAEVAIAEVVVPTDDLSFDDSTFDDLDELVMQNMQVKALSELPPPPPELMKSDDSQELLNPLTDKTNKLNVDIRPTDEDKAEEPVKKTTKSKKSKKSTENIVDDSSESKKKKKKKKKVKTVQSDNNQTEEVARVEEKVDLETINQEPALIKPRKVTGVPTVIALGENGVPLKPSEVTKLQKTEMTAAQSKKLASGPMEDVGCEHDDSLPKIADGQVGKESVEQGISIMEYDTEPGSKISHGVPERGRTHTRTSAGNVVESKLELEFNQSLTDMEVAQITDAAEARRKAREAARAQRLWHKKMIEEGKDPRVMLKSRSHSRETFDDQPRKTSPSPTRRKVTPSPDTYTIVVEGSAEVNTSKDKVVSISPTQVQGEEGQFAFHDSKKDIKKKTKKSTESLNEEVEKKKKKKKTISANETGSQENLVTDKKKKKKKKTSKQSDIDQSGEENLTVRGSAQPTPPDTVISHVWKEAMEGKPLASSETVYEEREEPLIARSEIRRSRRGRRKKKGAGENDIQVGREMDVEQVQQNQDGGLQQSEAGLQDLIKPATVPRINKPSYDSAEDDYNSDQENELTNILSLEMSAGKRAQLVDSKELNRQQQKLSKLGKKYKLIEGRAGVDEEPLKQEQQSQDSGLVTLDRSPQAGKQQHQQPRSQHTVHLQQAEDEPAENIITEEPLPDSLVHRAEVPKMTHGKQASYEICKDEDLLSDQYSEDIPVASVDLTSEQREAMMRAREARKQQQIKKSLTRQMQENENLEEQDVLMEHPLPVSDGRMSQRAAQARRPQAVELQQTVEDPRLEDDRLPEDFIKRALVPDIKTGHGGVYKTNLDNSDELEVVTEPGQPVNLTEAQQAELRKAKEVRRLQQSLDKIAQRRQQMEKKSQSEHSIQDKKVPLDKKMLPSEPEGNKNRNYAVTLAQQHDELPAEEDDDDSSSFSENLMKKATIPTSSITRTFDFSQEDTDDECHGEQADVITVNLTEEQRASIAKAKEEKRRAKEQVKQERRNRLEIEEKGECCIKVEEMETQEVENEMSVPDKQNQGQRLDEEGYLLPQSTHKHIAIKINQPYQGEDEYTEITETIPDYEIRRAKAPNLPPRQTFETDIDQVSDMPYQEDAFKLAAFAAMKEMQNQNRRAKDGSEDMIGQSTAFTRSSSSRIRVKRGTQPNNLPQAKEIFIDRQPDLMGEDALPPDGNTDAQLQEELARLQGKEPTSTPLMSELWQEKKDQESEMQLMLQSVQDTTELQLTDNTGHLRTEQSELRGNLPQPPNEPLPSTDSAKPGQKQSPAGSPYKPPRPPQKMDKRPPPGPHLNDSLHTSLGSQGASPQGSFEMAGRPRSFSEGRQFDPQLRAGPEGKSTRHMQPVKRRIRRAYPSDGELYSGHQSDSEAIRKARRVKSISFYGDFRKGASEKRDRPPKITASQSLEEAAWQQIRQEMEHQPQIRPHRVIKPHGDKPINYTRGIYRPTPIYWRGSQRSFANTSRYDDSELIDQLWNERHRSMTTESEGDADLEDMSYDANMPEDGMHETHQFGPDHHVSFTRYGQSMSDDEHVHLSQYSSAPQLPASGPPPQGPPGQYFGAFQPIGPPKKVTIVDKKKRRAHEEHKDLPPRMIDPGPVDFKNYGAAAKLWMEQVDKTDMQKSKTMYLSMMGNQQPPPEILKSLPDDDHEEGSLGSQWVIARGRSLRRAKYHYDQQRRMDSDADQGSMDPGKQMLLFFKIGENWKDLAWVLFDGLQSDGDTLRMLKEIQHRHPDKINDQVHDMMHRWWKKKGSGATIEELQRGLEVLKMAYVEEEYINSRGIFSETETELDISTASEDDAEVNRLIHDYKTRSLNASFENKNAQNAAVQLATPESSTALNTDNLLRKLEEAAIDHIPARINRSSITMSSPQPPSKPRHEDSHGESDYDSSADGTHRHSFVIIQPQLDSKEYKHETNM